MIQRRKNLRLAPEPRDAFLIEGKTRRQRLDRDFAPKFCVARSVDVAHPAGADGFHDFIRTKTSSGLKRHAVISRQL